MYTIKDISKKFSLPASTIRYYEKIGLLEDVEHRNGYQRIYNESHIDRLNAIECFKNALLPLDDIKLFFEYEKDIRSNSSKIVEMMKHQKNKSLEAMDKLKEGLVHIQKKIEYYSMIDKAIQNNQDIPKWEDFINLQSD